MGSIQAHEMSVWFEQWAAFKNNSAFGSQGEAAVLAYLQQCVSRDILLAVGYRDKHTEKDLLDAIRLYLDSKIHPKILHQLEIWKSRQAEGNTVAETMRRQIMAFYDSNMDANSPQDWLKLLLYATTTDKEILTKILAKTRELETPHQIIEFVDAEESGKKNAGRLLGGKANIARAGFQGGGNKDGTRSPKCFACQDRGHTKSECTVDPSTLWCVHCKTKNHNTYNKCPKNKNKKQGKETPKIKQDPKNTKSPPKKGLHARSLKQDDQTADIQEIGDDEEEDMSSMDLFSLRLQFWPFGGETDDDLESSEESEVFFLDEDDTDLSGEESGESGYFTPPNSPAEVWSVEDLITDDEDEPVHPPLLSDSSDDEEDESSDEPVHPPLLSDSEPSDDEEDESSDDEDNSPLNRYLNNRELRDIQGKDDQIPPGARVWTEDSPQDDSRMEHQEVTAELLYNLLGWNEEGEAATDDVTALESPPITGP